MVCRGRKHGFGTFCLSRGFSGAPGERKHAVLRSMRPPSPRNHPAGGTAGSARTRPRDQSLGYPFLGNRPSSSPSPRPPKRRRRQAPARGLVVVCAHDRPKRNERQRIRPLLVGRMRVYSEPTALAAGTAGTRSRVQSLEDPFLGSGGHLPRRPRLLTAADGKPLLVGLPSSVRTTAPSGTNRSLSAPCSWGGQASTRRRRLWPPTLSASARAWAWASAR